MDAPGASPSPPSRGGLGLPAQLALVGGAGLAGVALLALPFLQEGARLPGAGLAILLVTAAALGGQQLGLRLARQLERAQLFADALARGELRAPRPPGEGDPRLRALGSSLAQLQAELKYFETTTRRLAQRDLAADPGSETPVRAALRGLVLQLRELVRELSGATVELEAGAREVHQTLRDQEKGAHDQASAVEQTRRTMNLLLQASEQIAVAAERVHENAKSAKDASETIARQANQLNTLTTDIGEALESINDIVDKSEILALNAALEGTKAGDAGKGFILVAEEMRRLAERVQESVQHIHGMVKSIRDASQASVHATEQGLRLADETARSAETIRITSQQQQNGTKQVTQSMFELTDLLTQALAGAEQSTRALEDLSQRAGKLKEVLAPYRADLG